MWWGERGMDCVIKGVATCSFYFKLAHFISFHVISFHFISFRFGYFKSFFTLNRLLKDGIENKRFSALRMNHINCFGGCSDYGAHSKDPLKALIQFPGL